MPQDAISILDVGHGNCAVLHCDSETVIVDAGPGSSLMEFLEEQGISKINALLVSHADKDHIEGVLAIISSGKFEIDVVRLNSDSLKGSALWEDLVWVLDEEDRNKKIDFEPLLTSKQSGEFNAGRLNVEVLGPSTYLASKGPGGIDREGRKLTSNSISATIRVLLDDVPLVLLSADLDQIGLDELLYTAVDLRAQTLVFPHHGGLPNSGSGAKAFTQQLCAGVEPKTVIFSIGRGMHGTPRPEIVQEIRSLLPNVRIACTQLSTHCAAVLPSKAPTHLSKVFSYGKGKGFCCAGTLVVELGPRVKMTPSKRAHDNFISSNAPNALCRRTLPDLKT